MRVLPDDPGPSRVEMAQILGDGLRPADRFVVVQAGIGREDEAPAGMPVQLQAEIDIVVVDPEGRIEAADRAEAES